MPETKWLACIKRDGLRFTLKAMLGDLLGSNLNGTSLRLNLHLSFRKPQSFLID